MITVEATEVQLVAAEAPKFTKEELKKYHEAIDALTPEDVLAVIMKPEGAIGLSTITVRPLLELVSIGHNKNWQNEEFDVLAKIKQTLLQLLYDDPRAKETTSRLNENKATRKRRLADLRGTEQTPYVIVDRALNNASIAAKKDISATEREINGVLSTASSADLLLKRRFNADPSTHVDEQNPQAAEARRAVDYFGHDTEQIEDRYARLALNSFVSNIDAVMDDANETVISTETLTEALDACTLVFALGRISEDFQTRAETRWSAGAIETKKAMHKLREKLLKMLEAAIAKVKETYEKDVNHKMLKELAINRSVIYDESLEKQVAAAVAQHLKSNNVVAEILSHTANVSSLFKKNQSELEDQIADATSYHIEPPPEADPTIWQKIYEYFSSEDGKRLLINCGISIAVVVLVAATIYGVSQPVYDANPWIEKLLQELESGSPSFQDITDIIKVGMTGQ